MNNVFTIKFGVQPQSYINRDDVIKQIYNDFSLDFPLSSTYIISGIRGCGKTVLLTSLEEKFKKNKDWIVVDINPNREILDQIAAGIYENSKIKHLFNEKTFSFQFHGVGFSITGKTPVSNIKTIVDKMLDNLDRHNKKLLIAIDEAQNNSNMRSFVHDFQTFIRENHKVFLLMTGLYENVHSLQDNKGLTFLYRSPKIDLSPLKIDMIEKEYKNIFKNENRDTIKKLSNLTKGYAFAYQVVGYLFNKYHDINKLLPEYDSYLSTYSYQKIWENIPNKEKEFLKSFKDDTCKSNEIMKYTKYSQKEYSVYRDRLIKRGILLKHERGSLLIVLPRFILFIDKQL